MSQTGAVTADPSDRPRPGGRAGEVLIVFLGLGLTSFGGPIAHLGYFRRTFVERRRWLTEQAYADLVALCQFLPGPASSQVGMAIGLQRAGWAGLLAAWLGFTLPSALLMVGFGYGLAALGGAAGAGWVAGLKAAAVGVVAHAVVGMARSLVPDLPRAVIALAALAAVLAVPAAWLPPAVLAAAALAGLAWVRPGPAPVDDEPVVAVGRRAATACLVLFGALLAVLPLLAVLVAEPALQLADGFYRTGSLVFGGGHVVLPLLQAETVQRGLLDPDTFLAGYAAAQALPGPLFAFAAFLGFSSAASPNGPAGAGLALTAIYLPSALLVAGTLPFWHHLRGSPRARAALGGVNAGVVGVLAAALVTPVFTSGVRDVTTAVVALAAFAALVSSRVPPWVVVLAAGAVGGALL